MCGLAVDDDLSYGAGEDLEYGEEEDSLQEGGEMELLSCLDEESEAASSVDDQSLVDDIDLLLTASSTQQQDDTAVSYRVSLPRTAAPVITTGSPSSVPTAADTTSLERTGSQQPSSPLTPSLFSYRPPSIHFPLHNEPCEEQHYTSAICSNGLLL